LMIILSPHLVIHKFCRIQFKTRPTRIPCPFRKWLDFVLFHAVTR
jgi:hypothetical protein